MLITNLDDDIDEAIDKINGSGAASSDMAVQEVGYHDLVAYLVARYDAIRLLIQQILKAADKRKGGYDSDSSTSTLPPPYETSEMKLKRARRDDKTL